MADAITILIDRTYQQEIANMPHLSNQEHPVHPKSDYTSDPITALALDVYLAAYQPYGEANPDRVAEIEEWLRAGDLDGTETIESLAAEWLALDE